jgi:hypothetical protein
MALLGKTGALSISFRQAVALIKNERPISAVEAYESSDLKRCVDAIAEITGAARDENGSFDATYSAAKEEDPFTTADEQAHFHFLRQTDGKVKGIALNFDVQRVVKEVHPIKCAGAECGTSTSTKTSKGSAKYNFTGDNINFLKINLPDSIPLIGGDLGMMPDDHLPHVLSALAKATPGLLAEITQRTGLQGPAPEPILSRDQEIMQHVRNLLSRDLN